MNIPIDPAICSKCKLNSTQGINKIFGEQHGRPVLIVTQSPSAEENDAEELLTSASPAGKFMWRALETVGIEPDSCDVTAAVRCIPAESVVGSYSSYLRPRAPSKEEIKLCASYTASLVQIDIQGTGEPGNGTKAILVLGQVAAKQLLGREYRKNQRIVDSAKLGMRVFCVDHPGFFLRAGIRGLNENDERLKAFRKMLLSMSEYIGAGGTVMKAEDYLKTQHYRICKTGAKAWKFAKLLKKWAIAKNERLAVDVEDSVPDDFAETGMEVGSNIVLTCAVSPKPGYSVMFVIDHSKKIPEERDKIVAALKWLLSDPEVKLVMHYGSSDAEKLQDILDIETPGYRFDTFSGMYMNNPGRHSYGLGSLVDEHLPAFAGYKTMIAPYVGPRDVEVPVNVLKNNEALYNFYKTKSLTTCAYCGLVQFINPENEKHKKVMDCKQCKMKLTGPFDNAMDFSRIPLGVLRLYNNADADVTKRFEVAIRKTTPEALAAVYTDMGHLLMRMERNGPLVDPRHIEILKTIWPDFVKNEADKLKAIAAEGPDGDPNFNPNTPEDIGWLLWTKLKIPYPDPKAKKYSTGKEILLQLVDYPIAAQIIQYRKYAKSMSTYITGYEYCASVNAGHLRTKWWLTGARTGRLSSGGSKEKIAGVVNLQNIQKLQAIRNIIVSDLRWRELAKWLGKRIKAEWSDEEIQDAALEELGDLQVFLEFDQGQVEVRLAAQLSGDKNMIADCEAGDIHSQVGSRMTGWSIEKIKSDSATRTRTKNVHFGILFGLKPEGILRYIKGFDPTSKITLEEVEGYYRAYFERYPGMAIYIEKQHIFAELHSYVETIFGMRRPLIINEQLVGLVDEYGQPAYWKNIAVNTPVQGSAHQLLMCGLIAFVRQPAKYGILGTPQMEVHDNLVMGVKLRDLIQCYWLAKELLEEEPIRTVKRDFPHIDWKVKLEVDGAAGFRFGVKQGLTYKPDQKSVNMAGVAPIGAFLRGWHEKNKQANEALKALREPKAA